MFRFPEAPVLHDETSWSAWGMRRRRPARPPSAPQNQRAAEHLNTAVVLPTTLDRRTAPAQTTHSYRGEARRRRQQSLRAGAGPGSPGAPQLGQQVPARRRGPARPPHTFQIAGHERSPPRCIKKAQNRPEEESRDDGAPAAHPHEERDRAGFVSLRTHGAKHTGRLRRRQTNTAALQNHQYS